EDLRHRQQRRPGVEPKPLLVKGSQLATDVVRLLADGDLMPQPGEPSGRGETTHAGPDDNHPAHKARPFQVNVPRCLSRTERVVRAASARIDSGCRKASGHTRP